jgi:hypothetical protein
MMKIDLKKLRAVASIRITQEPEDDYNYAGHFDDDACVTWIREELARGNEWAWCQVKVSAVVWR